LYDDILKFAVYTAKGNILALFRKEEDARKYLEEFKPINENEPPELIAGTHLVEFVNKRTE
jgi:hypothetical protein